MPLPAVAVRMVRPTSVEPVKAILSTPGCLTSAAPVAPSPVTMLTTPGGSPASATSSANSERRERRELGRLEHDGVAGRQRRRDFPRQHQQREVPRDDLPHHADRRRSRELARPSAAPSRRGDRNAARRAECRCRASRGSACRCRATRARRAAENASAPAARARRGDARARARPAPTTARCAARAAFTAASTSAAEACATMRERLPVAGFIVSKASPPLVRRHAPPMKMPEPVPVPLEPLSGRLRRTLRGGAVLHRLEDFGATRACHAAHPSGGGGRPSSGPLPRARAGARCR